MTKKEKQIKRIMKMQKMLQKDREDYTEEEEAILRGNIIKHSTPEQDLPQQR